MVEHLDEITTDGNFRAKVERLVIDGIGHHYELRVHNALRSVEKQKQNVAAGVSKTMRSKHLPGVDGLARGVDVIDSRFNWGAPNQVWLMIGRLALTKGLVWGGLYGLPRSTRKKLEAFLLDRTKPFDPAKWVTEEGKPGPLGWDPAHVESATCKWDWLKGRWNG